MLTCNALESRFSGNRSLLRECALLLTEHRFPHAVIIEGDDGLGKSTLARLLAQGLFCTADTPLCGKCSSCIKAEKSIHPDLTVVTGEGKANAIPVQRIREIHADAYVPANEGAHKVYILEDCDNMSPSSQNALLKIFEEPPAHVVFILTCRSRMSLLTTILSRARVFTVLPVDREQLLEKVGQVCGQLTAEQSEAAAACAGNIGQALALLTGDDSASSEQRRKASLIAQALCAEYEQDLLDLCVSLGTDRTFCAGVLEHLRLTVWQAVTASTGADVTSSPYAEAAAKLSKTFSVERLYTLFDVIDSLKRALSANIDARLLFPTLMCARLRRAAGK